MIDFEFSAVLTASAATGSVRFSLAQIVSPTVFVSLTDVAGLSHLYSTTDTVAPFPVSLQAVVAARTALFSLAGMTNTKVYSYVFSVSYQWR